jgi:hypothetical protein
MPSVRGKIHTTLRDANLDILSWFRKKGGMIGGEDGRILFKDR